MLIQRSQVPETVPLLPLGGTVLFPAGELPVRLRAPKDMAAARSAAAREHLVAVVARARPVEPLDAELLAVGTLAEVKRVRESGGCVLCALHGLARIRVVSFARRTPFLEVSLQLLEEEALAGPAEIDAFRERAIAVLLGDAVPYPAVRTLAAIGDPCHLVDMAIANASTPVEGKQRVLEAIRLRDRLSVASELLEMVDAAPRLQPALARARTAARRVRWRAAVALERLRR